MTVGSAVSRRTFIERAASLAGTLIMTATSGAPAGAEGKSVTTGAARLAADGFSMLRGKRVGLLTNHTGRIGSERAIDAMAQAPDVTLAAILTPEHGLSGAAEAGAKVAGGFDAATGIRVHSLYGSAYKPTPAMLAGLDLLVFDMQDVGARFYTYISTMGLAMQAAAAAGLPFVVLDRPNPLGGDYVSGYVLEKPVASFVGRFEFPIAHGLTVGELAGMIKGEHLLPGLDRLALDVVAMDGWTRTMRWPDTGLGWIATSPNIPTFATALAYAGTGLFEATTASEGRGTTEPFLLLGHADVDTPTLAARIAGTALPGVGFEATRLSPRSITGVATSPRFAGRSIPGIRLRITDGTAYRPVETGIHLLAAFAHSLRGKAVPLVADTRAFDRFAGTDRLRLALERGTPADAIIAGWQSEVVRFVERRGRYLLYA